jgi:hypothetical protein
VVERVQEQKGAERDAAIDKGPVIVVPVAVPAMTAVSAAVTPETAPTAVTPEMASAAAPPEIAPTAVTPEMASAAAPPEIAPTAAPPEIASTAAMPEFASTAAVTGATPAEIAPAYLDHRGSVGQTCGRC